MCDRAIGRKIREIRETEQPAIIDNSKNNPAIIDNSKNVAAPKHFDARPRDWLHQKKDFPSAARRLGHPARSCADGRQRSKMQNVFK
jgi:hypothetical protein